MRTAAQRWRCVRGARAACLRSPNAPSGDSISPRPPQGRRPAPAARLRTPGPAPRARGVPSRRRRARTSTWTAPRAVRSHSASPPFSARRCGGRFLATHSGTKARRLWPRLGAAWAGSCRAGVVACECPPRLPQTPRAPCQAGVVACECPPRPPQTPRAPWRADADTRARAVAVEPSGTSGKKHASSRWRTRSSHRAPC